MKSLKDIHMIDLGVYIAAIFLDSFGIALMIKSDFGASPFGIFVSSLALILPISTGMISLIYEIICIYMASRISRSRIKFELLIYSGVFAIMLDLQLKVISDGIGRNIGMKVLITLMAIGMIDLSKALFNISILPKLSVVELIYAVKGRWDYPLKYIQKTFSVFNVGMGLLFSAIAGVYFYNLGLGTLISMFLLGTVLHWISRPVELLYNNAKSRSKTQEK